MNTAIIIGCAGQDGTLLREYLEQKNYQVIGLYNPKSNQNEVNEWNVHSKDSMRKLFRNIQNCEVYYLAAYHHSSEQDSEKRGLDFLLEQSFEVHVNGLINVLSAIDSEKSNAKVFYASSSLIFSGKHGEMQKEDTPIEPVGAYGISKAAGGMVVKEFREKIGLFVSTGILYNHESGLRKPSFLTRRVIETAYRISQGSDEKCLIGNLSAKVDWGYAEDYVKAFHAILQLEKPDDFIVASGKLTQVQDFVEEVFRYLNLDWREHVVEGDSTLYRQTTAKCGNPEKLKKYTKCSLCHPLPELVELLVKDVIKRHK